jgi:hypothetical protein
VDLSTVKGDLFTFYYLNTGSLILGFSPKSKPYTDPSYYSYYSAPQQAFNVLSEQDKMTFAYLDPLGYNR